MFSMTCEIRISGFAPFKPSALSWNTSLSELSDKATITLPAAAMLKKKGDTYERVKTGMQFKAGMSVEIYAGYNTKNDLQFKGFISRINYEVPLVLECQGYSYQLQKKGSFSKSYKDTTIKKILQELIKGTDIRLSENIPDIKLKKVSFPDFTAMQVLEWINTKCLLVTHFVNDTLYVGTQQPAPEVNAKLRLGWNVIKDNELSFQGEDDVEVVRVEVENRDEKGVKTLGVKGKTGAAVKKFTSVLQDKATLEKIAEQKLKEASLGGYGGTLELFLKPYIRPGMAVMIEDEKYPDRKGKYVVASVEGKFSSAGGRQKIKIGYTV